MKVDTLLSKTTIFEYRKGECYFQNNKYTDYSLGALSNDEIDDPWLSFRELSDEIEYSEDHIFWKFNTEIEGVIRSYQKLAESVKGKPNQERWGYHYSDIIAFYESLGEETFNSEIQKKFDPEQREYKILGKMRETRNKFFSHRNKIGGIEIDNSSSSELDLVLNFKNYRLVLSIKFDYIQFINILKSLK